MSRGRCQYRSNLSSDLGLPVEHVQEYESATILNVSRFWSGNARLTRPGIRIGDNTECVSLLVKECPLDTSRNTYRRQYTMRRVSDYGMPVWHVQEYALATILNASRFWSGNARRTRLEIRIGDNIEGLSALVKDFPLDTSRNTHRRQ